MKTYNNYNYNNKSSIKESVTDGDVLNDKKYNRFNVKPLVADSVHEKIAEYIKTKSVDFTYRGESQKQQDELYQGRYIKGLSHLRNILTAYDTIVRSDDGKLSPINRLSVNGVDAGLRRDYPKSESLGQHFNILYKERPSVNVVLASDADIKKYKYPRYFEQENKYQYGDDTYQVKVLSARTLKIGELHGQVITIEIKKMTIKSRR